MTAFVIEGVDRSGKTTLIERLHKEYGLKIVTVKRPSEDGWDKHLKEFTKGKEDATTICGWAKRFQKTSDFVLDRFSYSELVYCRVFHRPCDFPWYERLLKANKQYFKLIYVYEDPELLFHRWKAEDKPTEYIVPIQAEYTSVFARLEMRMGEDYIMYCPTKDNIETLFEWIQANGKNSFKTLG